MAWHVVCAAGDIPADRGWPVTVEGRPIAIFRAAGDVVAVANQCLHIGSPIDDGVVESGCVTCPWHGWRYDLHTGAHLTHGGPEPGLATYPVREREGRIEVDL